MAALSNVAMASQAGIEVKPDLRPLLLAEVKELSKALSVTAKFEAIAQAASLMKGQSAGRSPPPFLQLRQPSICNIRVIGTWDPAPL